MTDAAGKLFNTPDLVYKLGEEYKREHPNWRPLVKPAPKKGFGIPFPTLAYQVTTKGCYQDTRCLLR